MIGSSRSIGLGVLAALMVAGCGGSAPVNSSKPTLQASRLPTHHALQEPSCRPTPNHGYACGVGGRTVRRTLLGQRWRPGLLRCPVGEPGGFDLRTLIGLTLHKAEGAVARHGCTSRIVEINGRGLAITDDLRSNRVDLAVSHGMVTSVDVG